ncbi:EsaB/YukD family protein [Kibdelosporangium phytohabitans]|uniref:EccD-like transmembrane domain-containing protein n=1 Tax=Kibdelosporangium phytohabitans TaxID=860235 RepID=A0A0N9HTC1_9PSEU|nr:EsaB/YukD family protein [Kibdelosporangium phytohabitans]ALG06475.1 hypothetical protein AOZ06_05625 [Kibdelosporangium phytohabitans]MBE1467645.1 type VII secretion integral membrane protein EccD [Kibdelosporangium phytohabitans]
MNPAVTTGTLTRLTLAAPRRRIDLVLPSEAPLGELLPEIVRLLGYRPVDGPQVYRMSLLDGRVVEPHQSLRAAGVSDGALVRVDRISEAPMPPVVHDVTDEVADDLESRSGRWGDPARRWTTTAIITGAASYTTALALLAVPAPIPVIVGALVLVAGTVLGLTGGRAAGTAVVLAGAAVVATALPSWLDAWPSRWFGWLLLLGVTVLAIGAANNRLRAGATGAGTLIGLLGLWGALRAFDVPEVRSAALLAVACTVLLGLLPRLALIASGLTRLDDQHFGGTAAARGSVTAALDSAHRGLALAVVFVAGGIAVSGWILGHSGDGWAVALACAMAVATWLRARTYPLTAEVAALNAAPLVVAAGLLGEWTRTGPDLLWLVLLLAGLIIGTGFLALSYRPSPHLRARARQLADHLEGITVVATVPIAVGVFEVYETLLAKF